MVFGIKIDVIIYFKFDSDIWWVEGVEASIITRGWNSTFIDTDCIRKFLNIIRKRCADM